MYPKNITVLSKISNEIVFHKNYDSIILKGIQSDPTYNKVLLCSTKEPVLVTSLKGED